MRDTGLKREVGPQPLQRGDFGVTVSTRDSAIMTDKNIVYICNMSPIQVVLFCYQSAVLMTVNFTQSVDLC